MEIELYKPIQCYSCFQYCQHLRPQCPTKHEPEICSRCTGTGHKYYDCLNTPVCLNCQGPHPVTARICPFYINAMNYIKSCFNPSHTLGAHTQSDNVIDTHTHSDKAIGTDILRAAALEASNKEEFLTSLFENCKQNIISTHSNEANSPVHYTNQCDLNETYSTLPEPVDIITKDDTALHQAAHDLSQELNYITEISKIQLPKVTSYIPPTFLSTPHIQIFKDFQYALTNNGIEELNENVKTNFRYCTLKEPQSNELNMTHVLFKTALPQQNITFFTDCSELSIETEAMNAIELKDKSQMMKLITKSGLIFELGLYSKHTADNSATKNLAQWLNNTYSIPLYHTTIT